MFIYHTSDIHIRPGVYDDIKFTWNEMIEKMTEGILVIAGDLFERKGHFVAEDISCYCELIDAVPKNIPIIIIPGNHDYNRGNLDAISPIKLAANRRDDIYYFPKSGIYNIKNYPFDFHILSPMDGIIPPITNKKKLKIAIIHEQIGRLTINQLSLYDLVLAGDSHEVHFLTDKIAYCGSLIQKTANESLEHGFIKWDLSNLKGEFIPLPQNNVILSLHFKHNKLEEFPPGIFNKVKRIDFHHEKCSIEYVNKTFHELQEKYKCPIRKIDHNKIIQNEPLPEDTSSEQLRLLQENLPEDIRDVILERHKQEIKILPSRNKWRLNYLQWDNFLCYGSENHIIFTELSGLYLLSGPNRIGKSTILDILCFTLYGEPIRGNISELIRKGESSLFVACGFTIGNKNYIISRRRGKSRDTYDELRFSEENELPHVITGVNNIREYIISLLGPLDQFLAVNIAIQDRILNDNLATYFENYLGLDSLQKIYDTVRGELTALNSNIKRINQDLVKKEKLNRVSLVSELRNIEISLKDFEDRIQELNNRIQRKQNEICQLKLVLVPCEKVREEEEIQKELSKIPEINITDEELSLLVSDPKNIGTNKEERIKELQSLPSNLPDIEEVRERLKNYYGYEKRKTNIPFENLLNGEFKEVSKTREEINKELESISEFQIIQTEYKVDKVSKSQLKELEEKIKKLESIPQIKSRHTSYSEEEIIKLSENIKDTISSLNAQIISKSETIEIRELILELIISHSQLFKFSNSCPDCSFNLSLLKQKSSNSKLFDNYVNTQIHEEQKAQQKLNILLDRYHFQYHNLLKQYQELKQKRIEYLENKNGIRKFKLLEMLKQHDINDHIHDRKYFERLQLLQQLKYLQRIIKLKEEITICDANIKSNEVRNKLKQREKRNQLLNELEKAKKFKEYHQAQNKYQILTNELEKETAIFHNLQKEYQNILGKKISIQKDLDLCAENEKKKEELLNMEKQAMILKHYKDLLDPKSGIPLKLLKNFCNRLETAINEILHQVTDFEIMFKFEQVRGKEILKPLISPGISFSLASGFQKFIIDTAIRLALMKDHQYLPNILILDEGINSADFFHLQKFKDFLNNLSQLDFYEWIIIISHIDIGELQTLNISKTNNYSKICYPSEAIKPFTMSEKIHCECGAYISRKAYNTHLKSRAHILNEKN